MGAERHRQRRRRGRVGGRDRGVGSAGAEDDDAGRFVDRQAVVAAQSRGLIGTVQPQASGQPFQREPVPRFSQIILFFSVIGHSLIIAFDRNVPRETYRRIGNDTEVRRNRK